MRFKPKQVQSSLRAILLTIGEFIHISAIYLGLATITILVLSFVLPALRQQSTQLHDLVLAMFQSYEIEANLSADPSKPDWSLPENLQRQPNTTKPQSDAQVISTEAKNYGKDLKDDLPNGPLDISFTSTLSASIHDTPINGVTKSQEKALRSYLGRKYKIANTVAGAIIRAAFAYGKQRNLDPQLILAVIAIESRYNPFAESSVGAQGLMQVMTSVHIDKLRYSGGPASVFNPLVNIRVGTKILADCIKRRRSLRGGLACYVGATGPSDGGYGAKVIAESRRIALASGIPLSF